MRGAATEKGDGRRLVLALAAALVVHAGLAAIPLSLRLGSITPPGPLTVDIESMPQQAETTVVESPVPDQPSPGPEDAVAVQGPAPGTAGPQAAVPQPAASSAARPAAGSPAAGKGEPGQKAPQPPGETFKIPQPRQPAAASGGGPSGPSFREAGAGNTGGSQGSPRPAFRESGASSTGGSPKPAPAAPAGPVAAPITADTGGAVVGGSSPARGVGVTVQGRPAQGSGGKLDLGSLDKALAGAGKAAGAGSGSGAAKGAGGGKGPGQEVTGGGSGSGGGGGATGGNAGQWGSSIAWDVPAAGKSRKLLSGADPKVPAGVGAQGLTLRVVVSFLVSPEGIISQPRIEKSSGYNEADAAVVEAVRKWRFSADPGAAPIRGQRDYEFRVR